MQRIRYQPFSARGRVLTGRTFYFQGEKKLSGKEKTRILLEVLGRYYGNKNFGMIHVLKKGERFEKLD
jgi:hypothetical protein